MSTRAKVSDLRLSDLTPGDLFAFQLRMHTVDRDDRLSENALWRVTNPDPEKWSDFLRSDRIALCLTGSDPVKKLLASVEKKANSRRQGSAFSRADANYLLLSAVCTGLSKFNHFTQNRVTPEAITKPDWDRAIAAARSLRDLEKKGLRVSAALQGGPYELSRVPFNWLDQMIERLEAGKKSAKKAHADESIAERVATRAFAHMLLLHFGEAPPVMVETFAELIGYNSEAARKHVPRWIEEYRTHSLI